MEESLFNMEWMRWKPANQIGNTMQTREMRENQKAYGILKTEGL